MSDTPGPIGPIPGGEAFENAVNAFNKKGAAIIFNKFKLFLSTASDPFFRKDMGERYFSHESLVGGVGIWILATIIALVLPDVRSVAPLICEPAGLYRLEHLFQHWLPPLATGGLLVLFYWKFGLESLALMQKYRAEGTAYHSMSRGVLRSEKDGRLMGIAIVVLLLLFNLPAGVLFIASYMMSAKITSEQEAAIYSRYLDALDQKIEQEYLENAILGKCPPEITYLTHPLPADMNPELRSNIAAAAVGKPVKIIAKPPKPSPQV
jgi:hypothetical protein